MLGLGARIPDIKVSIGPAIQQASYEVGGEFRDRFLDSSPDHEIFFVNVLLGKFQFDLPRFIERRLDSVGITAIDRLTLDTCIDVDRFFSYRRATKRGEADYGRQISAIALAPTET